MAKDKNRTTFTGKKHSLPYSTEEVYEKLNQLEFITKKVGRAWFWTAKGNMKNTIVGYDGNTKAYVVTVTKRYFGQRFFVNVPEDKEEYKERINSCLPKSYKNSS